MSVLAKEDIPKLMKENNINTVKDMFKNMPNVLISMKLLTYLK